MVINHSSEWSTFISWLWLSYTEKLYLTYNNSEVRTSVVCTLGLGRRRNTGKLHFQTADCPLTSEPALAAIARLISNI